MIKTAHKFLFLALFFVVLCSSVSAQELSGKEKRVAKKEARIARRDERRSLSGEIQISGSFALYPMVVKWAAEFRKIYPRIKVDISAGGAGKGITDALSGIVDLGMISRDINPAEEQKGAMTVAVAYDAVVATVNAKNPHIIKLKTKGLKLSTAKELWGKGNISTWGAILGRDYSESVHLYTRSDACGASETWAKWLGVETEDLKGTAVYGDPGAASVVQRDKYALGYNSIAYAYNIRTGKPHRGIMIVPIDKDESGIVELSEDFYGSLNDLNDAIAEGKYPSPPTRSLYLVCKGVPQKPEVKAFLQYVLSKGQAFAPDSGYVPLSQEQREKELSKIE